jgi:hypothetical protein
MNCVKKVNAVSVPLCIIACFISLHPVQAQQIATSAHFGASALRAASTAPSSVVGRAAASDGSSRWTAGQGSFGSSAQAGGVWRDESTLSAAPGVAPGTKPARTFPANAFSPSDDLAAGSFSAKPASGRGNAESGAAHLSRSFSGQRSGASAFGHGAASKSSDMRHTAAGSRGRVGSPGRGAGRGENRPSSGMASRVTQRTPTRGLAGNSSLPGALDARSTKSGLKSLP